MRPKRNTKRRLRSTRGRLPFARLFQVLEDTVRAASWHGLMEGSDTRVIALPVMGS